MLGSLREEQSNLSDWITKSIIKFIGNAGTFASYKVLRSRKESGPFKEIDLVPGDLVSLNFGFSDGLATGNTLYYRVQGLNTSGGVVEEVTHKVELRKGKDLE